MHNAIRPVFETFRLNTQLVNSALENTSDEQLSANPANSANSIRYIVGHLTRYRFAVASLLGLTESSPWGEMFERGKPAPSSEDMPPTSEMRETWADISEKLLKQFETVSADHLASPSPVDLPFEDKTILGAVGFLAFHDSYHIGQISYVQRLLGLDGLAG